MEEVARSSSLHRQLPPPHSDAPWVNHPILFTSGPLRGKWIRAELIVQQQPRRGRKGAIHDLRPLHPPPTVRLKLWEIAHPVPPATIIPGSSPATLWFESQPIPPPSNAQAYPISIEPKHTTHFLCFASLFKVHPPTREQEYGRVDRKATLGCVEGVGPQDPSYGMGPGEVIERPKSDKSRLWKSLRPHPMTAISCHDPQWQAALAQARLRAGDDSGISSPSQSESDTNKEPARDIETIDGDLSFSEMLRLESHLPREAPKWVYPYQDVTAHLSKRETAGHLIPSSENGEPAFYFVFSDLAIRNEGYFSLRFHIVNLDWRVDPQFSRPGTGFFSPLCDCVTDPFAVYSTKEFPGLPPTTEFTTVRSAILFVAILFFLTLFASLQYLVRNSVRIRFRDDRVVNEAVGDGKGRNDGRGRATKKNSNKGSGESTVALASGEPTGGTSMMSFGSRDDADMKKEAILEQWRNSPGRTLFQHTFDADEVAAGTSDISMSSSSPLRPRAVRSNTLSSIRGVSSPQGSPHLHDRRSSSNSNLDPMTVNQPSPLSSPMTYRFTTTTAPSAAGYVPPTTQRRPHPPVGYRLLTQDLNLHPNDQRWSNSISPQSPPSPSYTGAPQRWQDEDVDMRFGPVSAPGSAGSQHSPMLMMRDRPVHQHRYYPYPQPASTSHGPAYSYDHERQSPTFAGQYVPRSQDDRLYQQQPQQPPQGQ